MNKKTFTREDIIDYFVKLIILGEIKPKEKLFSEHFISKKFGVNRSTVHEVYTVLESLGIVECIQGKGTYLKHIDTETIFSPLHTLAFLLESEPNQFLEFRKVIEIGVAEKVVARISKEEICLMYQAVENIKNASNYIVASQNDILIHQIYINSLGNNLISFLYSMVVIYIKCISDNNWEKIFLSKGEKLKKQQVKKHLELIKSLENKDIDKCMSALKEHFDYIETELKKS